MQFGNAEVSVQTVARLAVLAGPLIAADEETDEIHLSFERETYSRKDVMEIVRLVAGAAPDECEPEGDGLRLWWD